ncbi:MAG: DUF2459 domain-containing protein [SAR324 cluster bacterium]|jgi:uncharacterized protein (TIGR02117 family)|nr:hypothetical protein [Deltaproteobacteria bacterium]MDP6091220.1 DUF2459 domain-containing protein [SAR324 cluster bacterium]MDP6464520.1 DUF2459 domain-containing protein [SAR324 cluster bacterium]MDP6637881.1 DUF2459 domain-containing protein [SAR324 cluster bacterium]MDP7138661.1 DUF2459 domain-containing protein [SAR324 cluster bacterium]
MTWYKETGWLFLFIILLLSISGCASALSWQSFPDSIENERSVYVINHGWHAGLILPYESLVGLPHIEETLGYSQYYEFGWGDADFYQAEKITSGVPLKAILWPTDSVLQVVSVLTYPHAHFPHSEMVEVRLSRQGLGRLVDYISASFYRDLDSQFVVLGRGIYKNSHFFKATGGYQLTNNCNTWVAEALERSGVPVSSFLTLTSDGVMQQTKNAVLEYECCMR